MKVVVTIKRVYGVKRYFPKCANSEAMIAMMHPRLAFLEKDIELMREAGWSLEILPDLS